MEYRRRPFVWCILNEGANAVGVRGAEGEFSESRLRWLAWQGGVRTLFKTNSAIASQQDRVLHSTMRKYTCLKCEFSGTVVTM